MKRVFLDTGKNEPKKELTTSRETLLKQKRRLTNENVFVKAVFTNTVLFPSCIDNDIIFNDDTSRANIFSFQLLPVLCKDPAQSLCDRVGVLQNRTTVSFVLFLGDAKNAFPPIQTFVCDRHFWKRKAVREVFDEGVSIFNCRPHPDEHPEQLRLRHGHHLAVLGNGTGGHEP